MATPNPAVPNPSHVQPRGSIGDRIAAVAWTAARRSLDASGYAVLGPLLTAEECTLLIAMYDDDSRFRSRVVMARHAFGSGEYRYFDYPLPAVVEALRQALYPHLVPVANQWSRRLGIGTVFPDALGSFIDRCREAGQTRPTPLLLRYGAGDYNRLHQDLYGEIHFPLQVVILLSEPGQDYAGGELVLTEQRPRTQSRVDVVPLHRGEAAVITTNRRPSKGVRGDYRLTMRHGVSLVRAGRRYSLGLIFHDSR